MDLPAPMSMITLFRRDVVDTSPCFFSVYSLQELHQALKLSSKKENGAIFKQINTDHKLRSNPPGKNRARSPKFSKH